MSPGSWVPEQLEEYRILRPLGRGAMGEVFLALDTALDREVAIKFVGGVEPDARARERFFREARAIARVQHQNVLAIHRIGEVRGRPYLVSEYVEGAGLEVVPKPLPWRRVVGIGVDLAQGLAAVHRKGVLHGDIKPANVILTPEGSVKLVDFGLAELAGVDELVPAWGLPRVAGGSDAAATVSMVGASLAIPAWSVGEVSHESMVTASTRARGRRIAGTPRYMAPELWEGAAISTRSDVYALGALLYELCTGAAPHAAVPMAGLPATARNTDPLPANLVIPEIDAALALVLARCIARDAAARFPSALALADALALLGTARAATPDDAPPYPGLAAFDAREGRFFCGRSAVAAALLERLRADDFVIVTGESGCGKSSICRAVVLPAASHEVFAGFASCHLVELTPGERPIEAIAEAFAAIVHRPETELAADLRSDPSVLGRLLGALDDTTATLVFVDQLEELVDVADRAEAAVAAAALAAIAFGAPVRLLAAARSDSISRLASLHDLGRRISGARFDLPAMSSGDLRAAILGPLEAREFRFERDETVDRVVDAISPGPGSLPGLQLVLAELWRLRDAELRVIPADALDTIGGCAGVLERHADAVLSALPARDRRVAREVVARLAWVDGAEERSLDQLVGGQTDAVAARAAIDGLVRRRLVVSRESESGQPAFQLAHPVLLRPWIDRNRDELARLEQQPRVRSRRMIAAALAAIGSLGAFATYVGARTVASADVARELRNHILPEDPICYWEQLPGCGSSITTDYDVGDTEVTACGGAGDPEIFRWNERAHQWEALPGKGGFQVSRAGKALWKRTSAGMIQRYDVQSGSWQPPLADTKGNRYACASWIGASTFEDGLWAADCSAGHSDAFPAGDAETHEWLQRDRPIRFWNGAKAAWSRGDIYGRRVADRIGASAGAGGDSQERAWILRWDAALLDCCPEGRLADRPLGKGYELPTNATGRMWLLGTDGRFWRVREGLWVPLETTPPLNGVQSFAVSREHIWVVNNAGRIYRCPTNDVDRNVSTVPP